MTGPTWKYGVLDGGGYNWDSSGKSVTKFEGADLIPLSELAPTVTDRMKLGQPCQSCTGWQRIDTLRCIPCSGWSHQNYAPLSELATYKESLQVQNVSQEDLDSLLGIAPEAPTEVPWNSKGHSPTPGDRLREKAREAKPGNNIDTEAADEITSLTAELAAEVTLNVQLLHVIEHQQAMLIALVECKDALLKELVELKAQRSSYPAKATREMATALLNISYCAGETPFDCTMRAIDAALAAAPKAKPPGYGDCTLCGSPLNMCAPCVWRHNMVDNVDDGTEDNWTPKEGE